MTDAEIIEAMEAEWRKVYPNAPAHTLEDGMRALLAICAPAIRAQAMEEAVKGWRPIETAPRDGTLVLLYRPLAANTNDPVVTIRRTSRVAQHCWPDTIPPGADGLNFTEGSCYATHWMPLPAPPAAEPGGESHD